MARRRYNFHVGTLSPGIDDTQTAIVSPDFANLPAVVGDVVVVTLDPDQLAGLPEIIHVTAHTASSTTVTATRGQEGTAARAHNSGIGWVHAPTVIDFEDELVDDVTLEVASGQHRIKDGGVTTAKLADASVTLAKLPDDLRPVFVVADNAAKAALTAIEGDVAYQEDIDAGFAYDGAVWAPAFGVLPYVECTNVAAISFVADVTHTLTYDTEQHDTHAAFSAGVFTAPYAGVYEIAFEVQMDHTDSGLWRASIVRNSTGFNMGRFIPSQITNAETAILSFSRAIYLAAGDTLRAALSRSGNISVCASTWISIAYLHP